MNEKIENPALPSLPTPEPIKTGDSIALITSILCHIVLGYILISSILDLIGRML